MEQKRWAVRVAGAGVWAMASLTWGSIAHHLWGFTDVGAVLAILTVALVLALPPGRVERRAMDTGSPRLLKREG